MGASISSLRTFRLGFWASLQAAYISKYAAVLSGEGATGHEEGGEVIGTKAHSPHRIHWMLQRLSIAKAPLRSLCKLVNFVAGTTGHRDCQKETDVTFINYHLSCFLPLLVRTLKNR
jgi:hypothetical protein